MLTDIGDKRHQREGDINNPREERHRQLGWTKESHQCLCVLNDSRQQWRQCGGGRCEWCLSMQQTMHQRQAELYLHTPRIVTVKVSSKLRANEVAQLPKHPQHTACLAPRSLTCDSVCQVHLCVFLWQKSLRTTFSPFDAQEEERRRRFRIDTEVRCVGAHPPFWPLEPARVKPN